VGQKTIAYFRKESAITQSLSFFVFQGNGPERSSINNKFCEADYNKLKYCPF